MEIQSAFNAGVQGFQKATEDANQAARNIAANTLPNQEFGLASNEIAADGIAQVSSPSNPASNNSVNLTQSIVDLRVAEFQAKASGEVISSADENLGTLLDVRV